MKNKYLKFFISIIICQLAGFIGSIFTVSQIQTWYAGLEKPAFNPPAWIFGPVWTTLFLLMGISLFIAWQKNFQAQSIQKGIKPWNKFSEKFWQGPWQKTNVILIFAIQLVLNILWSIIFFGLHLPGAAFFELLMLWFAILYTIINFYRISKPAGYLLLPYLLWVTFAGFLNYSLWMLNL